MATREGCVHFIPEDGRCVLRNLALGKDKPELLGENGQCKAGVEVVIAGLMCFEPIETAQRLGCNRFKAIRDSFPPSLDV